MEPNETHVYHHNDADGPRINMKVERNSRGYNYEATVTGAKSVEEAAKLLNDAIAKLRSTYADIAVQG
jgi:hypothetical protein